MTEPAPNITSLVEQLGIDDKVRLLTGATSFTLRHDDSIGLDSMVFSDGPTGVRGTEFSGGPKTCLLPNATLLASTWSTDSLREVGRLLAEEAARQHVHVVLGPTINLHRSPLGGRLFEAYSEDPLLTGTLAAAYIDGLQSQRIGACPKHFVANESETERMTVDIRVDERTLREVYLLPFEIAITDADPWTVMSAYNGINGTRATEHDELNNRLLKGEWHWSGLLVSDWSATKTVAPAANGGLDLVMPGPEGPWGQHLVEAVRTGDVTDAVVNDHVARLLRLAYRVGALGEPREWPVVDPPDSDARRRQLTRLAASGMTVVKNSGVLPLSETARVALIGRHALETVCLGGGSSQVRAPYHVSIAQGLVDRLGSSVTVVDGVAVRSSQRVARPGYLSDPVTGQPGTRITIFSATREIVSEWVADDHQCDLHGVDYPDDDVHIEMRAVVPAGRQTVGVLGVGAWQFRIGDREFSSTLQTVTGDHAEAILRPPATAVDLMLDEPTEMIASVTTRLTEHAAFGLVAGPTPTSDDENLQHAVEVARRADVAVVVVGLTEEHESEGVDKHTLRLPGRQDELVESVAAVARRTIVIVNAATPVLMPWRGAVDAILIVGLPGQEAGHAVAAALLNDVEPSGRLVTTYPDADGSCPAWVVTPEEGVLRYGEGPFIGYRGHAAGLTPDPMYWFGHGLGYGEFSYDGCRLDAGALSVEVRVSNTSVRDSREVVQVYFDPQREGQPVRLAGWADTTVPAGGAATITVVCDRRMWRTWDAGSHQWLTLTGGELMVARGLGDVRHRITL